MHYIKWIISTCIFLTIITLLGACSQNTENSNKTVSPGVSNSAIVSTFSGTAVGMGYVDGTGSDARFRLPRGMVSDGDHLYIVDIWNSIIRKLVVATGEVSTFAGVARSRSFVDGVGNDAHLFSPHGITIVDSKIYFTDRNTVRSIDIETREVITIAGTFSLETLEPLDGVGMGARFKNLVGITTDGTSLYVVESVSKNIRKIDIATNTVTTLATGVGKLNHSPELLIYDDLHLYLVTSHGSTNIEKIEISSGTVTSLSGPWSYFASNTGSIITAITKQNEFFYVADSSGAIRRININTGNELFLAGKAGTFGYRDGVGAQARFWHVKGMVNDGEHLIVSDQLNHNIRKIEIATGNVSTLAGSGPGAIDGSGEVVRFFEPQDVTSDGENLYVTDYFNYTIRKISLMSGVVTTLAGKARMYGHVDGTGGDARFSRPQGITNDGTYLYLTDFGTVRKVEIATGVVTTLAGQPTSGTSVDGVGSMARFIHPHGITTDGVYVYIAEWVTQTIRKVHSVTGEVTTLAGTRDVEGFEDGTGVNALFNYPTDIATNGISLFVTDEINKAVRKIDIETGVVTTVIGMTESAPAGTLFAPRGIAIKGDFLFVTDRHTVRKISIESGSLTTIAGGSNDYSNGLGNQARFNSPQGITFVGSELYIADTENHVIRRIEDIDLL